MKILLITQKMDSKDSVLGFMQRWVAELAKHFSYITIICLEKGQTSLPANVKVLSLGKESHRSRFAYLWNFYRFIYRERKNYDAVFVHMNQIYVLLGGILWRLLGKAVILWYAHGFVPFSLRIAEKLTHVVLTSTKSGFRVPSREVRVIGQGVDVEFFKPPLHLGHFDHLFRAVSVGRLSPVKDYETLVGAVGILARRNVTLFVNVFGEAGTPEQTSYTNSLRKRVVSEGVEKFVKFPGALPNAEIVSRLQSADFFVNTSLTDSLDKAGLEAMACGLPVFACNEAYREVLSSYPNLLFERKSSMDLARKIEAFINLPEADRNKLSAEMRDIIVNNHSLTVFAARVSDAINETYHNKQ